MSVAVSEVVPAGVSLWAVAGTLAPMGAAVLCYWFVKARDTLDHVGSVLTPPRERESDGRSTGAEHDRALDQAMPDEDTEIA